MINQSLSQEQFEKNLKDEGKLYLKDAWFDVQDLGWARSQPVYVIRISFWPPEKGIVFSVQGEIQRRSIMGRNEIYKIVDGLTDLLVEKCKNQVFEHYIQDKDHGFDPYQKLYDIETYYPEDVVE